MERRQGREGGGEDCGRRGMEAMGSRGKGKNTALAALVYLVFTHISHLYFTMTLKVSLSHPLCR